MYPGDTEKAETTVVWMFHAFVEIRYEFVQN
jgi:hypothetical protein